MENLSPFNPSQTNYNSAAKTIQYEILEDIDPIFIEKLYTNTNS
jgi:hypothetical protein